MKEFVIPIIVHDPELPVPEHKNWGDWVTFVPQRMWR